MAIDEVENAGGNCLTKSCQAGDPMGARFVMPMKPTGETKDGVKTGRGTGLGTGDGQVDQWLGGDGSQIGQVPKGIGGGGPPQVNQISHHNVGRRR